MDREPRVVRLPAGRTVWVRPVQPSDASQLQHAFAMLSDTSRYRRFLTGTPYLTDQQATYLSDIDHNYHEALVALPEPESQKILGIARFIRYRDAPTDADLAITVDDAWQGRGLATALLQLLTERARTVGVRRFTVDMLSDNAAVIALVRRVGRIDEDAVGHIVNGHIDLEPTTKPTAT